MAISHHIIVLKLFSSENFSQWLSYGWGPKSVSSLHLVITHQFEWKAFFIMYISGTKRNKKNTPFALNIGNCGWELRQLDLPKIKYGGRLVVCTVRNLLFTSGIRRTQRKCQTIKIFLHRSLMIIDDHWWSLEKSNQNVPLWLSGIVDWQPGI